MAAIPGRCLPQLLRGRHCNELTDGRSGLVVTAELGKTQLSVPGRETHHSRRLKAFLSLFEIVWNARSIGYTSKSRDVLLVTIQDLVFTPCAEL